MLPHLDIESGFVTLSLASQEVPRVERAMLGLACPIIILHIDPIMHFELLMATPIKG